VDSSDYLVIPSSHARGGGGTRRSLVKSIVERFQGKKKTRSLIDWEEIGTLISL